VRLLSVVLALALGLSWTTASPVDPESWARAHIRSQAPALGLAADLSDLRLVGVVRSLKATHVRFQVTRRGLPVEGALVTVHLLDRGPVLLRHRQLPAGLPAGSAPSLSAAAALERAVAGLGRSVRQRGPLRTSLVYLPRGSDLVLAWRVEVPAAEPLGDFAVLVDARSGQILRVRDYLARRPSPARPNQAAGDACLLESAHPYPPGVHQRWTVVNPDPQATGTRLFFRRLQTADPYDGLLVRDETGQIVQRLTGDFPAGVWTVPVPGRTVGLELVASALGQGWGFCLERVTSAEIQPGRTGRGAVFLPNPIVTSQQTALRDGGDAETPLLAAQRVPVDLPGLDGSGYLRGAYVDLTAPGLSGGDRPAGQAFQPDLVFIYPRSDPRFEEVMVYYHIDAVQRYLQALGFTTVNRRSLPVHAHYTWQDLSFYSPFTTGLYFGDGGVDDAEDAEVIVHEYGHAILDSQVPGWGASDESLAIGEGFSDYLAASFYATAGGGFQPECVGEWDAAGRVPPQPCRGRVDSSRRYPVDLVGDPSADGAIWSATLWEINRTLGRTTADQLIIASHFYLDPWTLFGDAATALLWADQALTGGQNEAVLRAIFARRGIVPAAQPPLTPTPAPQPTPTVSPTSTPPPSPVATLSPTPDQVTRTLALHPGWNWIGLGLAVAGPLPAPLTALAGQYDLVLGEEGSYAPPPADPRFNTLTALQVGRGYLIRLTAPQTVTLTLTGPAPAGPLTLALHPGWNWVGYPLADAQPPENALAGLAGQYDLVVGEEGTYAPPPADPRFNTLAVLRPDRGYLLRLRAAATLVFPLP